jgi:hypothetical protein
VPWDIVSRDSNVFELPVVQGFKVSNRLALLPTPKCAGEELGESRQRITSLRISPGRG